MMRAMVIDKYGKNIPLRLAEMPLPEVGERDVLAEKAGFVKTILLSLVSRKLSALEKQYNVKYNYLFMKPSGLQLESIKQLVEQEKIKPVVDRIFDFEETQQAMEYVETGRAKGKVIVKLN